MKTNSFPHYLQLDAMDCGPSCLRMVAKLQSVRVSIIVIFSIQILAGFRNISYLCPKIVKVIPK